MSKSKNSRPSKTVSISPNAGEAKPTGDEAKTVDAKESAEKQDKGEKGEKQDKGEKGEKQDKHTLIDVASAPEEASESKKKGSGKQKLEFEGSLSRQEAVAQLEALAKGLAKGKISLQAKGQSVELSPSHHYDIELKAASKGSKERISIELSWRASSDPDQTLKVLVNDKD